MSSPTTCEGGKHVRFARSSTLHAFDSRLPVATPLPNRGQQDTTPPPSESESVDNEAEPTRFGDLKTQQTLVMTPIFPNGADPPPADSASMTADVSSFCMLALKNVQASRSEWVEAYTVDLCLEWRTSFLPQRVQDKLCVVSGFAWDRVVDRARDDSGSGDGSYGRTNIPGIAEEDDRLAATLLAGIRDAEYVLWPVQIQDHWVIVFMHLSDGHLAEYTVFDSLAQDRIRDSVVWHLLQFLAAGAVDISDSVQRPTCAPPQRDAFSCGLRIVQYAWDVLARIVEVEGYGGVEAYSDPVQCGMYLFPEVPTRYFDPDWTRAQMLGAVVGISLKEQGYRARAAIVPAQSVVNDDGVKIPAELLKPLDMRPEME